MNDGLFDTNILIDWLNGVPEAQLAIEKFSSQAISHVTWMEVLAGSPAQDEARTRLFLDTFQIMAVTPAIAEHAVFIRRTKRTKVLDAIILATAKVENRILITRNTRDFDSSDPGILIPYVI